MKVANKTRFSKTKLLIKKILREESLLKRSCIKNTLDMVKNARKQWENSVREQKNTERDNPAVEILNRTYLDWLDQSTKKWLNFYSDLFFENRKYYLKIKSIINDLENN